MKKYLPNWFKKLFGIYPQIEIYEFKKKDGTIGRWVLLRLCSSKKFAKMIKLLKEEQLIFYRT